MKSKVILRAQTKTHNRRVAITEHEDGGISIHTKRVVLPDEDVSDVPVMPDISIGISGSAQELRAEIRALKIEKGMV